MEISTILAVLVALGGMGGIAQLVMIPVNRRKSAAEATSLKTDASTVLFNSAMELLRPWREQVEHMRGQLTRLSEEHRAEMAEMSAQHQREMLAATQIIRDLETRLEKMAGQVQVLTRQLETLGH
jgi:hypothetical protein